LKETLILQLLAEHIGDEFEGLVTGVCSMGPFVRLQRYFIEGLIPLKDLGDDYWEVDQDRGIIKSRRGKKIKIGDPLKVSIVSVDSIARRLNLALVEDLAQRKRKGKKKESVRRGRGGRAPKRGKSKKIGRRRRKF
jgi:ribonuclease R